MTEPSKPPLGRRMKARAPPPPQVPQPAPRHIFRNTVPDGGGTSDTDAKENVLRPTVDLQLTLPQGHKASVTKDGSKALMDLLVELCSCYHLNPALHTLELLSPEGHPLGFKPNTLLGSLNVASVLIKEKVWEEKTVRRPAPKVPEKTVRLMVNYHSSQKAVVRVNPFVPLQTLIPVICDKCDFDPSHVLLLKDSISHHELPLDESLTELGIKELYVLDQSLVRQPKMASAPALNYSESIRSSTTSLGRPEKKGLLGIFSRRKSKTETTSLDMDDSDDKLIQNRDTHPNASSSVSGVPCVEDRPSTLGQSQSAMNISRMSPKFDAKKRRAPAPPGAPTPTVGHANFETYQMGLGSESQQRKRKAPAPPPTPTSTTPGPDDTSTSTAPSPVSQVTQTPTPATRTKLAQSSTVSTTTVVTKIVEPAHLKTEVALRPVCTATRATSSPTPSSSTTDSIAAQDSSSELSQSLDDSDLDPDQTGSRCSSLTSSTVSGSVGVQPTTKSSSSRMEESEMVSSVATELNQEVTSVSSSRSETELDLNLKMDEVENNRHSGMAWLHSSQSSTVSGQIPETETPEEETLSLGSSGGSSLPDQGYAASEGMAEGEDSGLVSSPSDTQPTSPDGSLSLDQSSGGGGERLRGPVRENSSDSDEGCATWGSRHRHNDGTPKGKSGRLKDSYEEDPELTARLHQTLADFDADLADMVSAKETTYTISSDNNEVPVSVVDMDVPVTAIDEVLEDYGSNFVENDTKLLIRTESARSKGPSSAVELQNTNNNACIAADDNNSSTNTMQPSKPEQRKKSVKNKSGGDKKKEKLLETKIEEKTITAANSLKEDKQKTQTVKSNVETPKHSKIELDPVKSNTQLQEKKPVLRLASTKRDEETQRNKITLNSSSFSTSHGKITRNVTSRFGMKTFTVVPPKQSVMHAEMGEPALTVNAIKIDEQGNMVKAGISQNKFGGSLVSDSNHSEGSPLLGKAKAFWSLNERQENPVPQSKGLIDKAKESTDDLRSTHTAVSKTVLKTDNIEDLKKTQNSLYKPAERNQPKESVKEEAKEPVKVAKEERVEIQSKITVSKNVPQPSNGPTLPCASTSDLKRDLPFLKPSRRTSSQYVASAITKYTPKTSAKPESSTLLKTQSSFQRSGRSIQVNPRQSSQTSLYNNNENASYVSDSQRDFGEVRQDKGGFGKSVGSTKESSNSLGTATAKHSGPTQINVTASNDKDNVNNIQGRSPSPPQKSPLQTSAKQPTAPKTEFQDQTSNTRNTVKATHHLTSDAKSESSVTVSDNAVVPGSLPVSVFGPVKKFKPVICKSVEKDTSLHSSLMEAIQTGGGKDRLKKISSSGPSNLKKISHAEDENERSALLAAIRAPSTSGRLRKTKSEAAGELEKFRKIASENERSADLPPSSSPPSLTATSPILTPPPSPMFAPPPPPPPLPQGKPTIVAHPSANTPLNPGLAREAMLEAIRSGSAAERLKKVAAPKRRVQVNGRLGTIQATSSTLPQQ